MNNRRRASKSRPLLASLTALGLIVALPASTAVIPAYVTAQSIHGVASVWDGIEVDLTTLPSTLPERVTVVDGNGKPFATFFSENRVPMKSLEDISPILIDTLLAVEDSRFYENGPIDIQGTIRALLRNSTEGTSQGGSTLTQQYVKNLRVTSAMTDGDTEAAKDATESSLNRKLEELKWASELEKVLTKDEILLGYLNIAYFGNGAYGIGAAAHYYFGTDAASLNYEQSALLVGLLKNPVGYNPFKYEDAATERRGVVIGRMASVGMIDKDQAYQLRNTPLGAKANPLANGCTRSQFPLYCDWVKSLLLNDEAFGQTPEERERRMYNGGFTVHTALDPKAMKTAQKAVSAAFESDNRVAAATVVIEPGSGHVIAMAQSHDYERTQFNYALQSSVQTGSTFKPIVYATALDQGIDPGIKLNGDSGHKATGYYGPKNGFSNSGGVNYGTIDANEAMKHSVNTFFTRLAVKAGVINVADTAFRMGMTSMDPDSRDVSPQDLTIALGAFEATPMDVASVYATIAAEGVHCTPVAITKIVEDGETHPGQNAKCQQAIDPSVANKVGQTLAKTFTEGGTAVPGKINRPAGGKTGTTNNFGATWFAGYTPTYATSVWVGDPRGLQYPLRNITAYGKWREHVYGGDVAAPIWKAIMSSLHEGKKKLPLPKAGPIVSSGARVPSVLGLSTDAGISVLQDAGYSVEVTKGKKGKAHIPSGVVLSQVPAEGAALSGDFVDKVTITVSP